MKKNNSQGLRRTGLRIKYARTGILKPSLRIISIASVPLLIAENYLQIPWYAISIITPKMGHLHMAASFLLPDVYKHTENDLFTMVFLQPAID